MSSSVSSERAFSSAGLTVTKRRNRLKGDIVEALQVIKCALRNDLLMRATPPSTLEDADLVHENSDNDDGIQLTRLPEFVIELSESDDDIPTRNLAD